MEELSPQALIHLPEGGRLCIQKGEIWIVNVKRINASQTLITHFSFGSIPTTGEIAEELVRLGLVPAVERERDVARFVLRGVLRLAEQVEELQAALAAAQENAHDLNREIGRRDCEIDTLRRTHVVSLVPGPDHPVRCLECSELLQVEQLGAHYQELHPTSKRQAKIRGGLAPKSARKPRRKAPAGEPPPPPKAPGDPVEEGAYYLTHMEKLQISARALARFWALSETIVRDRVALAKASPVLHGALRRNELTLQDAQTIAQRAAGNFPVQELAGLRVVERRCEVSTLGYKDVVAIVQQAAADLAPAEVPPAMAEQALEALTSAAEVWPRPAEPAPPVKKEKKGGKKPGRKPAQKPTSPAPTPPAELPVITGHVAPDARPETLQALGTMVELAVQAIERGELKVGQQEEPAAAPELEDVTPAGVDLGLDDLGSGTFRSATPKGFQPCPTCHQPIKLKDLIRHQEEAHAATMLECPHCPRKYLPSAARRYEEHVDACAVMPAPARAVDLTPATDPKLAETLELMRQNDERIRNRVEEPCEECGGPCKVPAHGQRRRALQQRKVA